MAYQPLCRKYRPSQLSHIIGQNVLTQTIANAIKSKKISSSFLITGTRGTGKTTAARIISKSLNCLAFSAPTIHPCNTCENCTLINNSNHPDTIEIDAASHTGVDDIKNIIESSAYSPSIGKYKINIIDEAHMLSNSAFNAMLKSIEEPQEHIIWILATTDAHKIPQTISSRCQNFHLKNISCTEIKKQLNFIAKQENIHATEGALLTIAINAGGSMRDAISLLDQASIYAQEEKEITAKTIETILSKISVDSIIKITKQILDGNAEKTLNIFQSIHSQGIDPLSLLQDILSILNALNCIILKITKNVEDKYLEYIQEIHKMAESTDIVNINILWQVVLKGMLDLKNTICPFMNTEMILTRMCTISLLPKETITQTEENAEEKEENYLMQKNQPTHQDTPTNITNNTPPEQPTTDTHQQTTQIPAITPTITTNPIKQPAYADTHKAAINPTNYDTPTNITSNTPPEQPTTTTHQQPLLQDQFIKELMYNFNFEYHHIIQPKSQYDKTKL